LRVLFGGGEDEGADADADLGWHGLGVGGSDVWAWRFS
jgi:hypothetical protein